MTDDVSMPTLACRLDGVFAVLRFTGADAVAFLHGQLSCQVAELPVPGATPGSYNTAKGRMLATFVLVRAGDHLDMVLDRSLAAAIEKRLRMFVLRAKVTIALRTDVAVIGLAGAAVARASGTYGVSLPETPYAAAVSAEASWIRWPDARVLALLSSRALADHADAFAAARDDAAEWARRDIAAGLPWITAATQDQLVAQMVNLELLGGVSFQKGCYPGQEIVARTQHLGKVKRRMYRGHVDASAAAGDPVYGTDVGDQASGVIVNAVPGAQGGSDVLAVMHASTARAGAARLGSIDGAVLTLVPLPYGVE